ncbi:hypothetical protein [Clostridium aminobutyricum]|uniref:Uncharacterized protein n=1 Tax=Clostridium aminobutyricum TaxID=33953 RepID=A0A939D764_CLOAM|nr:hypothetical protein [Clostridium aminobutyricum]MBN7772336.1 hypothetical protein [Clostridium aminobutyricum]
MIITIITLLVGLMILGGGIYYLLKEKEDKEARKIYSITTAVGVIITAGVIVKVLVSGF